MVELLNRYSNLGDQIERLVRLLALPPDDGTAQPVRQVRAVVRLTEQQETELTRRYQLGETLRELACHYGIDRETVSKLVKRGDVHVRYHQTIEVDLNRATELHQQGLNLTEVAALLGVGRTTLVRARRSARS